MRGRDVLLRGTTSCISFHLKYTYLPIMVSSAGSSGIRCDENQRKHKVEPDDVSMELWLLT